MFPNYLFIFVDLEEVTPVTLKSTRGISRIIHFGSESTPISSKLVYQLMSRDDSDEARASYASLPCSGDKVLIEEGRLPASKPSIWSRMGRNVRFCWSACSTGRLPAASTTTPSDVWTKPTGQTAR